MQSDPKGQPANDATVVPEAGPTERSSLTRRLSGHGMLLVILGVLLVNSVIFYNSLRRLDDAADGVRQTLQARHHMAEVMAALTDAETGQRGFLVTSDHRYLAPYHQAHVVIDQKIDALREHVGDNPDHLARLDKVQALSKEKLSELASVVTTHIQDGSDASRRLVQEDRGRTIMDEIRKLVQAMDAEKTRLLTERDRIYEEEKKTAATALIVFIATTLTLLGALYFLMRREVQRRNALALVKQDAAVMVEERELSGDRIAVEILGLAVDSVRRGLLGDAARRLSRPDAARVIAEKVLSLAR